MRRFGMINGTRSLPGSKLVIMKWMGTGLDTPFLQRCVSLLKQLRLPFYIDAAGSKEGELAQGLTPEQLAVIKKYCMFGGEINYSNLWLYLQQLLQGETITVDEPNPIHWCGIYHPRAKKVYTDLVEYQRDFCVSGRPTAGILFYRDEWVWGDLTYQTAMIEELEAQGVNAVCVFSNGMPLEEMGMPSLTQVFNSFFCTADGVPAIDVLLNVMKFSMTTGGSINLDYLKKLNVPVLAAYTTIAPFEEWKDSFEGMNAMEVSISVSLPEFDGIIHGVPIAHKKILENGDVRYLPNMERVKRMASKAKKWAMLRHKANSEKKIAIIFHNYPPCNSNIGSAIGLDTIESIRRVLAAMLRARLQGGLDS